MSAILADLNQEITDGSTVSSPYPGVTLYSPTTNAQAVPALSGSPGSEGVENLLKRSAFGVPFYSGNGYATPASSRAANLSTSTVSPNGRSLTAHRWNAPLLLQKATPTSATDLRPVSAFNLPDWVLVSQNGSNPTQWNSSLLASPSTGASVVGRYAYTIYDEGGLLDMNVAGYPSTTTVQQASYKNALAYVDLRQLPGLNTLSSGDQNAVVDAITGWRNYASAAYDLTKDPVTNTDGFPASDAFPTYSWNASRAKNVFNFSLSNKNGYLETANVPLVNGQSDRLFTSRQQLINLLESIGHTVTGFTPALQQQTLQYLATFTRELNQPAYIPAVHANPAAPKVLSAAQGGTAAVGLDKQINPSYTTVRVTDSFTRNDGLIANAGDSLVNKRFALQRLAWLTYRGPSSGRFQGDADIQKLMQEGVPWSYLQLGTSDNIQKYFGLTWDNVAGQWLYNVHNNRNGAGKGPIMRVGRNPDITPEAEANIYVQDAGREPDFFEMLKSAITVGSLGKALASSSTSIMADYGGSVSEQPYNYNYGPESSTDRQIIQIGANIINQSRVDNFPVVIHFDDGSGGIYTPYTIAGVANLPYLYQIMVGVLQVSPPSPLPRNGRTGTPAYSGSLGSGTSGDAGYRSGDVITNSGVGAIMQMPVVWNPHDPSSPAAVFGPTQFRVVADSTTPDQIVTGSGYQSFFAYSGSYTPEQGIRNSYDGISPNSSWYSSPGGTGAGISHPITAANNEINFTATSGTAQLFPEPTILLRDATIWDNNNNFVTVRLGGTPLMSTDPAVSSYFTGKGLRNYVTPATDVGLGSNTAYLGFYLGAFPFAWSYSLDSAPVSGAQSGARLAKVTGSMGGSQNACYLTYRMQSRDASGNWITYDTKYGKVQDGTIEVWNPGTTFAVPTKGVLLNQNGYWGSVTDPRTNRFGIQWNGTTNLAGINNASVSSELHKSVLTAGWLNQTNGILKTNRPDAQSGFYFMAGWNRNYGSGDARRAGMPSATSGWMAWIATDRSSWPGLTPGLLSQNNTDIPYSPSRYYRDPNGAYTHTPNYFADPDGIVRRGMGAFVPAGQSNSPTNPAGDNRLPSGDTTVGLPTTRAFGSPPAPNSPNITNYTPGSTLSQAQSRPYFLHRPFRSVAELGCVFTDTPWRNLDFFTAESGNTALLDVFSINETEDPAGLVAGKVNLNTRQTPVLQAILAGAYLDPANVTGNNSVTRPLDTATASNVAYALRAYLVANGPMQNVAELVGKWNANVSISHPNVTGTNQPPLAPPFYDGKLSYLGFSGGVWDKTNHKPRVTVPASDVYSAYLSSSSFASNNNHNGTQETAAYIQRFREAPIRALSAVGQTRTWNLMIDLIAQTGSYPAGSTRLADFNIQNEKRTWLHVAIDRYTGEIIDQTIETVPETITYPTNLALSNHSIVEEQPASTSIGQLSAIDTSAGSLFSYEFAPGIGADDNASFTLSDDTLLSAVRFVYLEKSSYSIRLRVTNQNGGSYEKAFTINIQPSPYTQWKIANFGGNAGNATFAGNLIDRDGDGLSNLAEYVLNKNPNQPNSNGITVERGTDIIRFSYSRNSLASDATAHAARSADLTTWTRSGISETMLSDNGTTQLWQATAPLSTENKMFLRLEISRP